MSTTPGGAPFPAGLAVVILHDPVPADAPPDRQDTLVQARDVADALRRLCLAPRLLSFGPDLEAARRELCARPPALAVNLVESLAGLEHLVFAVPALLEALGIPCTGSGATALLATGGKSAAKRRLRQAGLATPDWLCLDPRPGDPAPGFSAASRFILKPEYAHGSVGIGPASVVRAQSAAELAALLAGRSRELGQPCLAEVFVPGREFSVAVVEGPDGPQALPPAEMRFLATDTAKTGVDDTGAAKTCGDGTGAEETRVLCYASKWDTGSAAYANSCRAFPQDDPELLARLADAALGAWRVFGLSGYARFDFRVPPDEGAAPQCIDVNANPCLARDAGLAAAALQAGLDFDALVARIVLSALGQSALGWPQRKQMAGNGGRWRTNVLPGDAEAVRRLVEATGFFNAEEVVIAGQLVEEHLAKGEASGYFYVFVEDGEPVENEAQNGAERGRPSSAGPSRGLAGYACFGPTPGTADSFDLYWIAVAPAAQGKGLGGAILARAEAEMAARGARGIYVETSSRGQYLPTRRFYEKHGYVACARLAGFYQAGDDKIIYNKRPGETGQTERT
jgi:D-alanine-D-alanine ligase